MYGKGDGWLTAGEMCNTEEIFAGQQLVRELRIGDVVLKLPRLLQWYVGFTRAREREGESLTVWPPP
jgi:hypothetical protein